ncbi:MAG: RNA polymerase sigma factor [Oscillibacter sp.]|jgi:RNA polymerase sigma-70 factor (ECF subfamily)|nr:RNA polymerase sigma factor [Oscillibacter sp.]
MKPPVEMMVETYRNSLYATAFSVCKNAQDAEDVVQDTFIQYLSQKKDFESEQHIRAWLLRVAINKAKNKNSTFFRRNSLPLEDYMETLTFESEESSELFETVMKLPEKYRIVIHLFYYEDYSVKEIADILKVTTGNVKVRLSRGRLSLRNTLKEVWEDDES